MLQKYPFQKIKFRLLCRRQRWVLTAQGWIITLIFLFTLLAGVLVNIHSFLAVNSPLSADALVVEGWIADEGIEAAIAEFGSRPYQVLITTGGPLPRGYYLSHYKTFAELSAATLLAIGFNSNRVVAVPADYVVRDRTRANAVALKRWLTHSNSAIKSINVYTAGVHARRSWRLYQKVLEPTLKVGIIAVNNLDYDSRRWWASSEGVKMVFSETISYLYASLFSR